MARKCPICKELLRASGDPLVADQQADIGDNQTCGRPECFHRYKRLLGEQTILEELHGEAETDGPW